LLTHATPHAKRGPEQHAETAARNSSRLAGWPVPLPGPFKLGKVHVSDAVAEVLAVVLQREGEAVLKPASTVLKEQQQSGEDVLKDEVAHVRWCLNSEAVQTAWNDQSCR
jgi:hypothetical protein